MNELNIWLDDLRSEPEGWIRAKTANSCIALLGYISTQGVRCQNISLDHDLGDDDSGTGYDVLCWIEEQVFTNESFLPPENIMIHTDNPSARNKMDVALKSIKKRLSS